MPSRVAAYDDYPRARGLRPEPKVVADRGDPAATAPVVLQLVDMDDPPLRLFLGDGPYEMIQVEYAGRLAEWDAYADLSRSAHRLPAD